MKLKLAAVAVALLLFATGAAMAMPGNAPHGAQADDHSQAGEHSQADEHRPDHAGDGDDAAANDSDGADENAEANESGEAPRGPPMDVPATDERADAANASQGPPAEMPDAVPDFVSAVHDAVREHSGGSGLGELISDLTPGGEADGASEESGNAGNATDVAPVSVTAGN